MGFAGFVDKVEIFFNIYPPWWNFLLSEWVFQGEMGGIMCENWTKNVK